MPRPIHDNLKEVYECLIDCVFHARPFEDIQPHIGNNVIFFGTAKHEKVANPDELRDLFTRQNKEMENIAIKMSRSGFIFEKLFAEGKGCLLVEEFDVTFIDLNHSFQIRLSVIFELLSNTWICFHFHGSTPDSNIDESEALPIKGLIKKNQELEETITLRTEELRLSLETLKSTQAQLIQSEKMVSLGELTAGIAHEIQNPLNFVNNFSDVNKELLVEMKDEMSKGNLEDATAIANDIIENSEKINHHGKRAEAIVKGMLQHSRSSNGQKEPTDINTLCDEYLRLSYHGLRAKDKLFNVTMKTDFDESIGNINIIPQDIGRVLLNLYNNAFYATNEKSKQHIEGYEPAVSVSTKKINDKAIISVKDNGNGIPQKIIDKIFQPFFTTKPTGQGTGLGLSLSYDIVKAHGGEIKVETKEGKGSEFIIQLPIV